VVDFFETALRRGSEALNIEDLAVPADSPAAGQTLEALDIRRATGVTILAVLREGTPSSPRPATSCSGPGTICWPSGPATSSSGWSG
jgi:K+/H+ antiporter YhaU regulatory subunit KhtT